VGKCVQCGKTAHADGSPVTWKCACCKKNVCRDCTQTKMTSSITVEYLETTLCSEECRSVHRVQGTMLGHPLEDE
jgi:hypothetical protein